MRIYRHNSPGHEAGFSLLEVLVATSLAGFIALGVVSMMAFAVSATDAARATTDLTVVAIDQMEGLNSLPFTDTRLNAGGSLDASAEGYSVDPVDGAPNAYLRWSITDESFSLKRITLVAGDRAAANGQGREITFETYRILAQ